MRAFGQFEWTLKVNKQVLTFNTTGSTISFSIRSASGAIKAKPVSRAGTASIHSARSGNLCFKELISVREDKNALGIDQNKQRQHVAAKLSSRPLLFALEGKPTLRQNISSGFGAGSTFIIFTLNMNKKV
jgi:hypothetical protein